MSNLTLYVDSLYTSPYAMSAFVALTEKQQTFELVTVDLAKAENLTEHFSQLSLTSRVPVLNHNGFLLSESSAIDEYIEETFSGVKLYPTSVANKARARQVQAWLRSDLMPIRVERSTNVIFYQPSDAALSPSAQQAAQKLFYIANSLLQNKTQFLFDEWCIADTDLALMLQRLILNGDLVPENLVEYARFQWQRPSVQAWVNKTRAPL
jgi:glutathione S-transferase